jgi:hypothetical protein
LFCAGFISRIYDNNDNCNGIELCFTHKNQSTATIRLTSLIGNPTACSTTSIVTKPACGTPAAPMDAAVAVILKTILTKRIHTVFRNLMLQIPVK